MSNRKDINIGLTGNDGTGDSIRDAFAKVNANFAELYASQGLEEGLSLNNLVDVIKPLKPNSVLSLDSLGRTVVGRELVADSGVSINVTNDSIILAIADVQISQDPNPTLANNLDAHGFKLSNVGSPENDNDAATRRWIYANFLNRDNQDLIGSTNQTNGSAMRANFKIAPYPDNGNPNAGARTITIKGSDGITNRTDVLLKNQAVDPAHATRKDYVDTKISLQGTETLDPATGLVNKGMGVMTGPLILNDHPGQYVGITKKPDGTLYVQDDYRAVTKGYVDAKSFSSPSNIFVSTRGNDDMWDFENNRPNPVYGYPKEEIGRSWAKAFKSLNAACRFAKLFIDEVSLQSVAYQLNPSQIQRWFSPLDPTAPKTRVRVSLQNHGYVDGDYVKVDGAILGSLDTRNLNGIFRVNALDANNFELNLKSIINWPQPEVAPGGTISISLVNKKDGPYSISSKVDYGYRGFFVPKPETTIMVESGVYFEDYPIRVPQNVAIKGDEFRRTIVKPKQGPADHELNRTLKFVRGDRFQSADTWYTTHYYHMIAQSVGSVNQTGSVTLEIKHAAYKPKSGMRFYVNGIMYRVGQEKSIVYKEPNSALNIATGTYTFPIVDDNGDPKPLAATIPDNTQIEFLLDNEHCDCLLVNDAFQLRNMTFMGSKGFCMAFDPSGQILTRSPYAQVSAVFAGEGGGGQYIDGYAGNQVCYVLDNTYTDPFTGTQGASGLKMTVTGLVRKPEIPNTFYIEKKKYVIIDSTTPDANGTATLTLSSTTPIEVDDVYLKEGFIPNATTIVIQTAGNRSMLSNDFTMVNDLGYGIIADNNGVCEAVSQFTYYCRASYYARSGGQIRTVTGSSCYGVIGLQSEGSDPNESIQLGKLKTTIGNIFTAHIEDLTVDGKQGAVNLIVGNVDSKPLRNSTFKLTKHEVIIKNIARARLSGGVLTTGPLKVTTTYRHPFITGDSVQMTSIRGVELKPIPPSTINRVTDIDGVAFTVTVIDDHTFTLDGTDSTLYASDLGTYQFADLPARAISNLVANAQDVVFTVKGDPSPSNINGRVRYDGDAGENSSGSTTLKIRNLSRPALTSMKFKLDGSDTVYKVTGITDKDVKFKVSPRSSPTGDNDNKIGATTIYITSVTDGWEPTAGWNFQFLDPNLDIRLNYTRYTIVGTPTYDAGQDRWEVELDKPLTVNMMNQIATAQWTHVDGLWDLELDRELESTVNEGTLISFYDSYYVMSIDPALTDSIPTVVDSYNKPHARAINLYQQKTISVSQILNRPSIINSSALRFQSSNYDPSIYRILGKTIDGGITTDTYELTSTIDPISGFNTNAVTKLVANKEWIQNEVIAYLNEIYPKLTYQSDICRRDVGYIIDAVAFDLTYGGNVRSRAAGKSYYQQGNPSVALVLSQQKPETIDAIFYALNAALTAINQYDGATQLQLALPYNGTSSNARNGAAQLLANKEFIQEEVIAFLSVTYPGFNYDEDKCRRDTGLILNAVLEDIIFGTNFQSRNAGLAYIRSYSSTVTNDQKSQTIAGLNKARDLAIAAVSDQDTQTLIAANFAIVTNIINAVSANVAPTLVWTDPLNTDAGIINGSKILQANREFIQDEIVAYVNSNFVGYTYTLPIQAKCERDVGYLVDGVAYDMALGTNFNSIRDGESYQRSTSNYVQGEQKVQTIYAIKKAQAEVESIVNSDPLALLRVTTSFTNVVDIVDNNNSVAITYTNPTGTSQSVLNAKDQLINNKTFMQEEILAYVTLNNPANVNPEICYRDAGYIIDAAIYDLLYGGNSASHKAAEAYFSGAGIILPSNEISPTLAAWTRLQNIMGQIVQGLGVTKTSGNNLTQDFTAGNATSAEASTLAARVQLVKDVISAGNTNVLPAIAYPSLTWTTTAIQTAFNDIESAKETIISTVSTYLTNAFSGFTYDSTVCARDTGYIIDALSYDLMYGGNSQTKIAGDAYYLGTTSFIPDQEEVTTITYRHLKSILGDIIQNIPVTPTTGNTSTQDTSINAGSVNAVNTVNGLTQSIIDVIVNGLGSSLSKIPPTYTNGNYYADKNLDRVTILNIEENIKNDVISFLNTTYSSGFQYNQITCARDVGLIVDAIAYDLEYEGNVKSKTAGLEYYRSANQSAAYVISDQKSQTIAALNRAKQVAKQIVVETLVTKTPGNALTQNTAGTPATSTEANRVEVLMTLITDIIQNGVGFAETVERDLGIRRSYQNPLEVGYISQNIDSGIVSEQGVSFTLTALMNQIAAILEKGPVNPTGPGAVPHIVEQPQVLDTLQTLDFPATATSLQYGGVLTGFGIPTKGVNGVTEDTIIRTVGAIFDSNEPPNIIGYRARISAPVTTSIPAGTEITVTGPGNDYLFDMNTAMDIRHQAGDVIGITTTFSTVRATGHDFLEVGAGGFDDSNYPHNVYGQAVNTPSSGSLVKEVGTGRVFHVSTDEQGNFRVGSYFNVNQGDGSVSIAAKIGLSAVTSLSFLVGATVNQFGVDSKFDDNSDNIVPTQRAIKTYIRNIISGTFEIDNTDTPQKGLLTLDGNSVMVGDINVGLNSIENIVNSPNDLGSVNRKYVDNVFAGGTINYDGSFEIATTGKRNEVLAFEMISDNTSEGGVPNNRGGIDLNGNKILRLKAPTQALEAANKAYVDQAIATGGVRTGWQGFTLSNTSIRNTVSAINMINNGSGYTTPPMVVVYSTTGTGASARAILTAGSGGRSVASIVVDTGGYGYTEAPLVIIGGSVGTINIVSAGAGYSGTPTITFGAPQIAGGVQATGYLVMAGSGNNKYVDKVIITNAGCGYTQAPQVSLSGGGVPTISATITTALQAGSGATATAIITATQRNIDLNGNKVVGSADPTNPGDLVSLNYFNNQNFIGKIADVSITRVPASGDLLVFTGSTPTGSLGSMIHASVTTDSDIEIIRLNDTVAINIKQGVITNADIASNAGILQNKLSLNKATVVGAGVTPAAQDYGIACFVDSQFTSTEGKVQLRQSANKTTGVTLDRIQQVTNYTVLGRYNTLEGATSIGTLTELGISDLKSMLGLSSATVTTLINDDTLGGLLPDGTTPSGLAVRSDGSTSYGALLKRGGTMRGPVTFTDAGGLPAGDAFITPIIRVNVTDKLDIGASNARFRNVYSKNHYGDVFEGSTFGSNGAPNTQGGGATFNGTATYSSQAAQTQYSLTGTAVGSGDIAIRNGANSVSFNGSQNCTISILADASTTNNSIVRRDGSGNINANTFVGALSGNATTASGLTLAGTTYTPSDVGSSNNTVPLRINGNINATTFTGRATTANYADLAENYQADAAYEPGTVLEFGGEFEVTIAEDETRRVAGIVSTDPAYLMNSKLQGENVVSLALTGRVPCKVRGTIRKGDMLVSAGDGYARPTHDPKIGTIIGKALENFDGVEGVIEVVVGRL